MAAPSEEEATENHEVEDTEGGGKVEKAKKHDSGAADLEKVTDYVEETEILSQNIGDAMRAMSERKAKEHAEKQEHARELAKVKISKEDVDMIVHEMEISRIVAERILREHKGDVVEALVALTD